jgi:hypothetical protein
MNRVASAVKSQLFESRWLTRGSTLQELVASELRVFLDSAWSKVGYSSKNDLTPSNDRIAEIFRSQFPDITPQLSQRTGVTSDVLKGMSLTTLSIAERMSWAADRQTTVIEDEAYCLLGIFDVNMPLIYGEGRKAFMRPQEEILKSSDDQSIFAHISPALDSPAGLFARSPAFFALSGGIRKLSGNTEPSKSEINITKNGITAQFTVCHTQDSTLLVVLDCSVGNSTVARPAICLAPLPGTEQFYCRYLHRSFLILYPDLSPSRFSMYIRGQMLDISTLELLGKLKYCYLTQWKCSK